MPEPVFIDRPRRLLAIDGGGLAGLLPAEALGSLAVGIRAVAVASARPAGSRAIAG